MPDAQEMIALGVVAAAAAWLLLRLRKRGLDEGERGCDHCPASAARHDANGAAPESRPPSTTPTSGSLRGS